MESFRTACHFLEFHEIIYQSPKYHTIRNVTANMGKLIILDVEKSIRHVYCMLICNKKRNKLSIFFLVVSVNDSRRHTKKVSKIFPPFDSFAISRLPNRNKPVMWSGAVASVVDWNREINESSLTLGTDDPLGWTLLTVFYGKDLPQYLEPIHGKLWMRIKSC